MKRYCTNLSTFFSLFLTLLPLKYRMKSLITLALVTASVSVNAQISGRVFRDYNANGTQNTVPPNVEPGAAGALVNAYNAANTLVASFTTNATGDYSIPSLGTAYNGTPGSNTGFVASGTAVRLEFVLPTTNTTANGALAGIDFPSAQGNTHGTSVQFITAPATSVNYAINSPMDYCDSTPFLAVAYHENGTGVGNNNGVTFVFDYNVTSGSAAPSTDADMTANNLGCLFGAAYAPSQKWLFQSAFLKRHAGFGPRGIDGVYVSDLSNPANPSILGGFDLQGVVPSNSSTAIDLGSVTRQSTTPSGDNYVPNDRTQPGRDLDAFTKVGKVGYGDIDLSEDGTELWLVNLNQKSLISVDLLGWSPLAANPNVLPSSRVSTFPIIAPTCTNGEFRPFALEFKRGKGYVGGVCDASASSTVQNPAGLSAVVLEFDPANPTTFTTKVSVALTYNREPCYRGGSAILSGNWQRWTSNWNDVNDINLFEFVSAPQPLLSDLEVDERGGFVMSFADRFSHQVGNENYKGISGNTDLVRGFAAGDILYANAAGVLESGEADPGTPPAVASASGLSAYPSFSATDGALGTGEYFWGDYFVNTGNTAGEGHYETTTGATAAIPGRGEVASIVYDPTTFFSQGVRWLNLTTGNLARSYLVANSDFGSPVGFGKGSGMGDIEAICDPAPLEIGNRIWIDSDQDGIQDAGESPIPDVTLEIYADFNNDGMPEGNALGTTNTNANGTWYFNTSNITDGDPTVSGNQAGLQPNKRYLIRVAASDWSGGVGVGTLAGYLLTTANVGGAGQPDVRDSDASLPTSLIPTISYETSTAGRNDHTLDMGFFNCPSLTNPSAAQTLCEGNSGAAITVQTNTNLSNSVRFVRFNSDQMAGSTPTTTEAAAIYAGTAVATVTPTGGAAPYTATLSTGAAGWNTLAPGTYYVYAILNPDQGAGCRPVQEIVVTIVDKPDLVTNNLVQCESAAGAGAVVNLNNGVQNLDGATLSFSEGGNPIANPAAAALTVGVHTIQLTASSSLAGCTSTATFTVEVLAYPTSVAYCPGDAYVLTAPVGLTNVMWYRNNVLVGSGSSYTVTQPGSYNYTGTGSHACATGNCCPSVFTNGPCYDFGDLPTGPYATTLAQGGPSHLITTGIRLGNTIDNEANGQPNATATGDGSDEDGLTVPTLVQGQSVVFPVTATNTSGSAAYLTLFVDWNADGNFNGPSEAAAPIVVAAGTSNGLFAVPYFIPMTAVLSTDLGIRVRLSTQSGLAATGAAADGEVEDYLAQVVCLEPTLTTNNATICYGTLLDLTTLVTGNTPAGTLTYHLTAADANTGANALKNTVIAGQNSATYYVRSVVVPGCFSTASMQVTVSNPPVLTVVNSAICVGGSINLATLVTSGGGGTLSYFSSLADAQNNVNALVSPVVTPASATNYFIRSTNAAGCYTIQNVVVSQIAANCGAIQLTGPN